MKTKRSARAAGLQTVPTGRPSQWRNPDTRHTESVTPTRAYTASARPCRAHARDVVLGGQRERVYGTACRQPDGSWRVVF